MKETWIAVGAALLLPGCAGMDADHHSAAVARTASRVPAATSIGALQSCIPLTSIRDSRVRSDRVIDWIMNGGKVYRTTLEQDCPSLGFEQRFSYATSLGQLCSTDIITVLYSSPVQQGARCGLAPFQQVKLSSRR